MNKMDEITYWIYTKRAPCLMNYDDDLSKKQLETDCLESKLQAPLSVSDNDSNTNSPKKRKRKLSLDDGDSVSPKGPENVFFNSSSRQQNQQKVLSSLKSSDVDFNIKKSSIKEKSKRRISQKNCRTTLHKKNIIISSTPKVNANLRRSLRNSRKSFNDSNQLNSSFEVPNGITPNRIPTTLNKQKNEKCKPLIKLASGDERLASGDEKLASGDERLDIKQNVLETVNIKSNLNGKFEDFSDVSGFTANYIRSTKLHSSKNGKRSKSNRSLLKESHQSLQKEQNKTVVCINKSVNTGAGNTPLNQSTDSSQNCVRLVTTAKCHPRPVRVSRSTSVLKFIDSKVKSSRNNSSKECTLDLIMSSPDNNTSRYPTRYRNNDSQHKYQTSTPSHKLMPKKCDKLVNNSRDVQENHGQLHRMRRGRSSGVQNLTIQHSDTSILVLSNVTEPVSSSVTVNVASPKIASGTPKNSLQRSVKITAISSANSTRRKCSLNGRKSGHSGTGTGKDSFRDKSGFVACFSESDDDKPLRSPKFFH